MELTPTWDALREVWFKDMARAWDGGYRQSLVAHGRVPAGSDPMRYGPPLTGPHRNPFLVETPARGPAVAETLRAEVERWNGIASTYAANWSAAVERERVLRTEAATLRTAIEEAKVILAVAGEREAWRVLYDASVANPAPEAAPPTLTREQAQQWADALNVPVERVLKVAPHTLGVTIAAPTTLTVTREQISAARDALYGSALVPDDGDWWSHVVAVIDDVAGIFGVTVVDEAAPPATENEIIDSLSADRYADAQAYFRGYQEKLAAEIEGLDPFPLMGRTARSGYRLALRRAASAIRQSGVEKT